MVCWCGRLWQYTVEDYNLQIKLHPKGSVTRYWEIIPLMFQKHKVIKFVEQVAHTRDLSINY